MPDFQSTTRQIDFTDNSNVTVKYKVGGVLKTKTAAEIIANANGEIAEIEAILGLTVDDIVNVDTAYAGGASAPLDEDDNAYKTTWETGKALKYTKTPYLANFLIDQGAVA